MEEDCFQYIQDLQKKNQRIMRTIMFCKVIEVLTMFKGGIVSSTLLKDAKNGFIMVPSQDIMSVLYKCMEHQENCHQDGRK